MTDPFAKREETTVCTYQTTRLGIRGSGKGAEGWFPLSDASVYFDHPVHASAEHTLNIDLLNPGRGPGSRVAVELDPISARELAHAILATLEAIPEALISPTRASESSVHAPRGDTLGGLVQCR